MQAALRPLVLGTTRRHLSSSPSSISSWIESITTQPPSSSTDYIDANRASQLRRSLPLRPAGAVDVNNGDVLRKGHHMIYHQPGTLLEDLGPDGTTTEYNAPDPYLRRMWAGGSIQWNQSVQPIQIGAQLLQLVSVPKVELKRGMLFVYQQRDLFTGDTPSRDGDGWAVREVRTHVFRQDVSVKGGGMDRTSSAPPPVSPPDQSFTFLPSSALLFRYSALTFNAHKIHYDKQWTRDVEGHPNLVFHGPLSATLLMEVGEAMAVSKGKTMVKFDYRAVKPMYVDREITLEGRYSDGDEIVLTAEQGGVIGMKATACISAT